MRKDGVLASGLQVNSDFQQLINDCFVFIQYMWLEHIQDIIYIYIYIYICILWYDISAREFAKLDWWCQTRQRSWFWRIHATTSSRSMRTFLHCSLDWSSLKRMQFSVHYPAVSIQQKKMPCYCHEKKRGIREFEELKRNRFKADSMLDVTVNQLDCCLACVKLSLRTPILRTQISNMILARDVSGPEKSDNPGPKFATKNVGEHLWAFTFFIMAIRVD